MSSLFRLTTTALITIALACTIACGDDGDGGSIDAAVSIDASSVDAEPPDANQNTVCNSLCTCATTYCGATMGDCLTECAALPASVAACRVTHCGYAQQPGGAATHCPHVEGDSTDQTTPAACIFDQLDAGP